uniref:Uncharacterized protein n=1 Tax=Phaeocystis antarctica TaxID=33657 RepID=A0A7S0HRI3_9EUKA|mmetsp:Transcript_28885/g.68095  ORF Transcript_28885/g.68095 Transcript_28885/m.68095 type:complete len:138 (+) Transcript_28885:52-465(+)
MLAIASCTSSALTLNGLVAARPAVAAQTGLPALVSGVGAAYVSLARPLQVGIPVVGVAALAWAAREAQQREALLASGEECMLGDEGKCVEYDNSVEATPVWKLQIAAASKRLTQTNNVADKLGSAGAPEGFVWGKTL